MKTPDSNPLVSIICFTYNHVNYIDDAMRGFLNQRTNFDYEILVHDDCSTDGTTEKVIEYSNLYPTKVRAFLEEENQYQQGIRDTWKRVADASGGKYIALCEGDDFWIDINKLQYQIDYMEENPDVTLTGHNALMLNCKTGMISATDGFLCEQDVSMEDLLKNKSFCFHYSSFVMKREIYYRNGMFRECDIGDWMVQLFAKTKGRVHYFDRVSSVYRYLSNENSWTSRINGRDFDTTVSYIRHILLLNRFFERFNEYTNDEFSTLISSLIEGYFKNAASRLSDVEQDKFSILKKEVLDTSSYNLEVQWKTLEEYYPKILNIKKRIRDFTKKYTKIYIMGTGLLSKEVLGFFDKEGIDFEGYVISDDQISQGRINGKHVFHLSEMIKNNDDYGIVIAIRTVFKDEIEHNLEENAITEYIWSWL